MSMLAEPRRKQKWSVDPRNSAWSNDDSKFGQKMLERMGWSKGKGLGRAEQGSTDHIKVRVKNDNYGFGTNASHEDKWIAHQDDFNELLTQLNNCHGQTNINETPPEEPKSFSLEEKSKTSKKRVHYMKFTKGKDLSSRSETDLNCIFGKRAKPTKDQDQDSSSSDSQDKVEENVVIATSELDTESITKTVKSSLTMQEYFAQRMAQLKKARGGQSAAAETSEEPEGVGGAEEPKKKKKKKKNKKTSDEMEEEKSNAPVVTENEENQEQQRSKKTKKKRKMAESDDAVTEDCGPVLDVELNCEQPAPSKKKKHNKNKESELQNRHEPSENRTVESEVTEKKRKKQRREGEESEVKEDTEGTVQKKSKKKKKKRRQE